MLRAVARLRYGALVVGRRAWARRLGPRSLGAPWKLMNRLVLLVAVLAAFLALPLTSAEALANPGLRPLSAEESAVLQSIAEDPAPKVLLGQAPGLENKHYLAGNEWHLYLYAEKLRGLGGAFMGVGSDQCYLLIGMQRPTLAVLSDYDDVVVAIHAIYFAFFEEAETRQAFLALWQQDNVAKAVAVLERRLPAGADKKGLTRLYRAGRAKIAQRLARVAKRFAAHKVASFVSDDDTYGYVRQLVQSGRVRAVRIDLLANRGVLSIGEALRKLGVPLKALYLSNAENYWRYTAQYRANIAALPLDPQGYVVRTVSTWNHNYDYIYDLQPLGNYAAWVSQPWVTGYRDFVRIVVPKVDEFRLSLTQPDVEAAQKARSKALGKGKAPSGLPAKGKVSGAKAG